MFKDRDWSTVEGASSEEIAALQAVAPAALPGSYIDVLKWSNGGEGPLPIQPLWLALYPLDEVIRIEREGTFKQFFSGLFVIGGNGGGEAFALDFRKSEPFPVIAFDMTNIDLQASVLEVAPSFDSLTDLIGKDR